MKPAVRYAALAIVSLSALAACDDPATKLAKAEPATGAQLQEFSRDWNDPVELGKNTPLLQRYCMNMNGAACAPDTIDRLKQSGFEDGQTGVDLAHAFVVMAADMKDGAADQKSSDEDFIHSCYRVMFGRDPDAEGAAHHLAAIAGQDEDARKALTMAFLKSPEFNSQK